MEIANNVNRAENLFEDSELSEYSCYACGEGLKCSNDTCDKMICTALTNATACRKSSHYIYKNKPYCLTCVLKGLVPLCGDGIIAGTNH